MNRLPCRPLCTRYCDVSALAYTVGSEVVFGERAYLPSSPEGRHLLAHELVHVAQQSRFAGSSADVMNVTEPEHATEREADEIAQRILNSTLVPMRPTASPLRLSRDEKPKSSTCVPPTSIALGTQHVLAPSNHPEDFTYGGICSVMKVSPAVADLCPGITEDVSSGTAGCPKSLMNADACKGNSTFKVGQVSRVCDVRPGSSEFVDRHSIKPEVESILDDPNRNPKHLNRCSYTCNQRYFMKTLPRISGMARTQPLQQWRKVGLIDVDGRSWTRNIRWIRNDKHAVWKGWFRERRSPEGQCCSAIVPAVSTQLSAASARTAAGIA